MVLGGELVGVVDAVVASITEGCLISGAEHRGLIFVTDITLDLHLFVSEFEVAKARGKVMVRKTERVERKLVEKEEKEVKEENNIAYIV